MLGEGSFSVVIQTNINFLTVAVKLAKGSRPLVLEYCELGSLDYMLPKLIVETNVPSYQPEKRNGLFVISEQHLHAFAFQIADGMAELAEQKLIHRDLAARNVFINSLFVIKIGDFGLSRWNDGHYSAHSDMPMSPEAAPEVYEQLVFTEKSDIFSYGILLLLLYDLSTDGRRDILERAKTDSKSIRSPIHANPKIFQHITTLIHREASCRPIFVESKVFFKAHLKEEFLSELKEHLNEDSNNFDVAQTLVRSFHQTSEEEADQDNDGTEQWPRMFSEY